MLRPVWRLVALAFLLCGVVACGEEVSDAERVRSAVEAFGNASAAKDYQRLCDDLLAPRLVEEVESAGLPCEVALKQGLGDVSSPRLTIGAIHVDGDKATADVRSSAQGQKPSRDTLQLVRVNDSWRIASLK
jgi:hypothetical protein